MSLNFDFLASDKVSSVLDKIGDKLGDSADQFEGWGGKVGVAAVAAGAALAGGVAAGAFEAMDIGAANDKLAAQLGATPEMARDLGESAGRLYSDAYGDSIGDVNEAMKSVIQSGAVFEDASSAQLEGVTAKVLDLTTAFDQDLGGTTRAIGTMIKTGMAKDADQALDMLTRGFQQGDDKADDLLDTMTEYPTQFRKLGLDGTQAMGMISQGLQAGARDADTVADALKEFSIRAVDGSKASSEAYKGLGLNAERMTAQIAKGGPAAEKGLGTVLDRLRAVKDPAERAQLAVGLFGTKAEDLGDALYALDPSTAAGAMGTVAGAADKMGQTLNDNAKTRIESFTRGLKTGFVDLIGDKVLPMLDRFAPTLDGIGAVIGTVVGFLDRHRTTALSLAAAIGALVIVTNAHAAVLAVQAAGGLAAYISQMGIVQMATKVWAAVQWVLNAALSANPIGIVIVLIAALVAGFIYAYRNSETFRNIVQGAMRGVQAAIGWVVNAAKAVWNWIARNWPLLLAIITGPIGMAVRFVTRNWGAIKSGASSVVDWVRSRFNALVSFVTGLPGRIGRGARGLWNGLTGGLRSVLNGIIGLWNRLDFGVTVSVPSWVPGIGGNSWGVRDFFPDISYLAQGGIVPATPGGRLAVIGEGGRDEVVAPLPPGGLAGLMAAGGGGATITQAPMVFQIDGHPFVEFLIRHDRRTGQLSAALVRRR